MAFAFAECYVPQLDPPWNKTLIPRGGEFRSSEGTCVSRIALRSKYPTHTYIVLTIAVLISHIYSPFNLDGDKDVEPKPGSLEYTSPLIPTDALVVKVPRIWSLFETSGDMST